MHGSTSHECDDIMLDSSRIVPDSANGLTQAHDIIDMCTIGIHVHECDSRLWLTCIDISGVWILICINLDQEYKLSANF